MRQAGRIERVGALIRRIEGDLSAELDTALISRLGYVSRAQLYRDFYSATGHSVKEYVRKRRLSAALFLIRASGEAHANIAARCGYSSQQAMCRAVKQALGTTPMQYKRGEDAYFFPPYEGRVLYDVAVRAARHPDTLRLRFYHALHRGIEERAVRAFLAAAPGFSGRLFGQNDRTAASPACYELFAAGYTGGSEALTAAGFEVAGPEPGFETLLAVTSVGNREETIGAAWDYLYSRWLAQSMFACAERRYFEEYVVRSGRAVRLRLCLPIRRREQSMRIAVEDAPQPFFLVAKASGIDAENRASRAVVDYMSERCPAVLRASRQFYLRRWPQGCACGVRVDAPLSLPLGDGMSLLAPAGRFLVLHTDVPGDPEQLGGMLEVYAADSGMNIDRGGMFAVYDAAQSYDKPRMALFCPLC